VTDELAWLDGVALADLVRRKELTPREVIDGAIVRAQTLGPVLGCLVQPLYDAARDTASAADDRATLAGVPMLVKDHIATQAGVRHTSGSRFLRDYTAARDSELVSRYRRGGMIPIATSATSEFALLATGESERYGPCRNPWDLTRIAGGSSGGSAAAVAAGIVPIAHGNDSGGSIRIPASACGLFGLKPTRGRNPLGPDHGDMASGLWAEHVITRSVRDSAAVLDVTAGPMAGDPYAAPAAPRSFLAEVGRDPGRLRIGFTVAETQVGEVSAECRAAVDAAAALCEGLGHDVEDVSLPVDDIRDVEDAFFVLYSSGAAWTVDTWIEILGREPEPGELEPYTAALAGFGRQFSSAQYLTALQRVQAAARRIAGFHAVYDILLTPTVATPPLPLGHFTAAVGEDPLSPLYVDAQFAKYTWIANATGQPAMSMPLHWDAPTGLPIGTHWTAGTGGEGLLFRLASQLEEANPWAQRRPPVCAQ
jgi:amidase